MADPVKELGPARRMDEYGMTEPDECNRFTVSGRDTVAVTDRPVQRYPGIDHNRTIPGRCRHGTGSRLAGEWLEFAVDPEWIRRGANRVEVAASPRPPAKA